MRFLDGRDFGRVGGVEAAKVRMSFFTCAPHRAELWPGRPSSPSVSHWISSRPLGRSYCESGSLRPRSAARSAISLLGSPRCDLTLRKTVE